MATSGLSTLLSAGLSLIPGGGMASSLLNIGSGLLGSQSAPRPVASPKPIASKPIIKRPLPRPSAVSIAKAQPLKNQVVSRGGIDDLSLGLKQQEDMFKKYALPVGLGIGGLIAIYMITNKGKR